MKKQIKNYRRAVLTITSGILLLLGCTNADYDFKKVDTTLGFGSGEVTLPHNNSTKEIQLDDLLDISNSDLVTTEANGDYKLFKEPDNTIDPVEVNINRIELSVDRSQELSVEINGLPVIPDFVKDMFPEVISLPFRGDVAGQSFDIPVLEAHGDISLLEYEFDADPAIKTLEYVEVGDNGQGVDLTLDMNIPEAINEFSSIEIGLPEMLTMTCKTAPQAFDAQKNKLVLTNVSPAQGHLQIVFNVTRINVKSVDDDNFVKLENGKFKLKTFVELDASVSKLAIPKISGDIVLKGSARFGQIVITTARGQFDPDIDLHDVGTVNINDLPDFLTEQEVVADIDNPQIWLTLTSTMPLGGTINAQLASDTHPTPIQLAPIQIAGSPDGVNPAVTRVVICRHAPGGLTGYTPLIVSNLSELIEKLKEPMQIKFTVTSAKADAQTPATVKLGHTYRLQPEYRFECPLAFGDKAVIVYSHTENNWNKDINMLNLTSGGYVNITATAVNKIPADLELDVKPLGVDGQELAPGVLNVQLVKKEVAGTKDTAIESPIEVNVSGDISKLDGVALKLKAKGNEQLRGMTLNKTTQTLQLKDLTVKLVGKVIYDAN